jgi:cell division protein FtsW (lipid II flippase)
METVTGKRPGRRVERMALIAIAVVLGLFFFELYRTMQRDMADVPQRIADGSIVNLNDSQADEKLKNLLQKGFYFEDLRDINLTTRTVAQGLLTNKDVIDNIGELNKSRYNVSASEAYANGGESYKKRVAVSRSLIGFYDKDSNLYVRELKSPLPLPAVNNLNSGNRRINGMVRNQNNNPVSGVLVRLEMIIPLDSVYSNEVVDVDRIITEETPSVRRVYATDEAKHKQLQSFSAYARTDASGKFSFTGLPGNEAFQVIPLQPGFQFGAAKGVQELDDDVDFTFTQAPHKIRLLSARDFNNLKREGSLIVRTPAEAFQWLWIIAAAFFLAFLLIHLFLSKRFPAADQMILPIVMMLTGLSLIALLSLQDPLRDRFLARSTVYYFGGGMIALLILLLFDFRRFTQDSAVYRMFVFRSERAAKGWQWGAAAVGLLILTLLLGTGPEGSGVKVNLFGFQPSEVVKFLVVFFLAGFFAANEKFIAEYATFKKRWKFFYTALAAILVSILLFLMLGDLGPAIVVCFTFIILFSFSRGDFLYMVAAVVVFVLANWLIDNVWIATGLTALLMALSFIFIRKQLSESAIMALVVIAGFLLIDQVPLLDKLIPGPFQRLTDRKAIWQNAWDNEVYGGDHVANGIWAMSSGGITGQGVGEGFAKTIPEAHTDMILPSIGEEFGWAGIICIFLLFLIYLHRSIIIGRHTGRPFLFYLCAGIGISSFVQFLLIAGGSTGALPLSGVSLPFLSYGGSSLIINLIAAGILLVCSLVSGTQVQMQYLSKQQDRNLVPALLAAIIGIILLSVNVSRYLFNNEKWVVQPALVADRSGARMFSYNPRIAILMNRLQAGSLYDRKGLLLATSKPGLLQQQRDSLLRAGLSAEKIISLTRKRQDRYYPFAEQMFFWTGDANTGVFTGGMNGYFAEYELAAELRGFETPTVNFHVNATRFREDRFLPQTAREMTVSRRDYSALAKLLLAGVNSKEVEAFKQRNRDVQMTVDAGLQTSLQTAIQNSDSLQDNRVSVVIMEAGTGDVIASAAWPLPPVNDWDKLTMTQREQNRYSGWLTLSDLGFTYATQPGSTAKIATALAAFNKLGLGAAGKTFVIRQQDLIRVKSIEPDETGNITMERAIVKSNNSYFIKLANEERLQEEMATVYTETGMFLKGVGGYYFEAESNNADQQQAWRKLWRSTEFRSVNSYNKNDIRRTRGRGVSGMAWGQGELIATPASVARLVSAMVNSGNLVPNRFVLKISDSALGIKPARRIANDPEAANLITNYMKLQSAPKEAQLKLLVGGKTGTPERIFKGNRINDGWYVFFAPKATGSGYIVTCIRIEATKGSSDAVRMAGEIVIPRLLAGGYILGFESRTVKDSLIRQTNAVRE